MAWCHCVASRCHSAKDLGLRSGASALVNAFDWRCECYSAEFRHDETHHLFNEHHNASGAVALIEKTHSAVGWILGTSCCDHAASLFLLPPHHWVVRYLGSRRGAGRMVKNATARTEAWIVQGYKFYKELDKRMRDASFILSLRRALHWRCRVRRRAWLPNTGRQMWKR